MAATYEGCLVCSWSCPGMDVESVAMTPDGKCLAFFANGSMFVHDVHGVGDTGRDVDVEGDDGADAETRPLLFVDAHELIPGAECEMLDAVFDVDMTLYVLCSQAQEGRRASWLLRFPKNGPDGGWTKCDLGVHPQAYWRACLDQEGNLMVSTFGPQSLPGAPLVSLVSLASGKVVFSFCPWDAGTADVAASVQLPDGTRLFADVGNRRVVLVSADGAHLAQVLTDVVCCDMILGLDGVLLLADLTVYSKPAIREVCTRTWATVHQWDVIQTNGLPVLGAFRIFARQDRIYAVTHSGDEILSYA